MECGQLKVYFSHVVSGRRLAALRARRQVEVGRAGPCRSVWVCSILHPALLAGGAPARVTESPKDTNPRCPFLPVSSSLWNPR